jgi:hypothetical protein
MVMDAHGLALVGAGIIGSGVALVHGVLVQRLMVTPLGRLSPPRPPRQIRQLMAGLLQFSTFNWFIGGLALIIAAVAMVPQARLATGLIVGSSYLFGAVGNFWASRARHPGWMLYAVALALIGYGLAAPVA